MTTLVHQAKPFDGTLCGEHGASSFHPSEVTCPLCIELRDSSRDLSERAS